MINIICDVCKKSIPGAITSYSWEKKESTYDIILDKAICHDCKHKMDDELRDIMDDSSEYGFLDHNRALRAALDRLTK